MKNITNFTRIKEALRTAIDTKKNLNEREAFLQKQRAEEAEKARHANRSISVNEPAEGYICPVCYFALTTQDELIVHWQKEHSLNDCENDVFQEIRTADEEVHFKEHDLSKDTTVIDLPVETQASEHPRTTSLGAVSIGNEEGEEM